MLYAPCFGLGGAVRFIDKFFRALCRVIEKLSLQPLLAVLAVWLILLALLPEKKITLAFIIIFLVLMGLALVYAIVATTYKILIYISESPSRRKERRVRAETFEESEVERETPSYYRVTQNPDYVMAEYSDRYELYYDDGGKLKYIKTTFKRRGTNDD